MVFIDSRYIGYSNQTSHLSGCLLTVDEINFDLFGTVFICLKHACIRNMLEAIAGCLWR